jgi:hypothetical protein
LLNSRPDGADCSAPSTPSPTLRSSEWLLTGSLFLIVVSLFAIAKIHSSLFAKIEETPSLVEVSIEGLVAKPGNYLVEKGSPLQYVLQRAKPKPWADLRSIDPKTRVKESLHLIVGKLAELKISLEGAVLEPGDAQVPCGTRLCDLKKYSSPKADPAFFKKRRLLKDGEVVQVPSRP